MIGVTRICARGAGCIKYWRAHFHARCILLQNVCLMFSHIFLHCYLLEMCTDKDPGGYS